MVESLSTFYARNLSCYLNTFSTFVISIRLMINHILDYHHSLKIPCHWCDDKYAMNDEIFFPYLVRNICFMLLKTQILKLGLRLLKEL